ncbi:MAG TPA: methionine synthase, partial [Ruminococcus sp.]|nr:methionine synthase [Ruminococcus sp.]
FVEVLDAPKRIGLCVTDTDMLTPKKSVTAVIGVSQKPLAPRRKGCQICSMREKCQFRKKGGHCGF